MARDADYSDMLKRRDKQPSQGGAPEEAGKLSPKMRELILSFDGKERRKRHRPRGAGGRFVSHR